MQFVLVLGLRIQKVGSEHIENFHYYHTNKMIMFKGWPHQA